MKKIGLLEAPFDEENQSKWFEELTEIYPDTVFLLKHSSELNIRTFNIEDSEKITIDELKEIVTNWINK
jgi:hypothetical protein